MSLSTVHGCVLTAGGVDGVKVDFFGALLTAESAVHCLWHPHSSGVCACMCARAVPECMCLLEHIIHSPDISPEDPSVMRLQILTDSTQPS